MEELLDDEVIKSEAPSGFLDKLGFVFGVFGALTLLYFLYKLYDSFFGNGQDPTDFEVMLFLGILVWPPLGLLCSYIVARRYTKTSFYRAGYILSLVTIIVLVVFILITTIVDWNNGDIG